MPGWMPIIKTEFETEVERNSQRMAEMSSSGLESQKGRILGPSSPENHTEAAPGQLKKESERM